MKLSVQEVTQWLNEHQNHELLIRKKEDGDIDETELLLHKVSIGHLEKEDPTEYLATETVLLHGEGIVISDQSRASLPQGVYEIPINEHWKIKENGDYMEIETDRAIYTIQAKN